MTSHATNTIDHPSIWGAILIATAVRVLIALTGDKRAFLPVVAVSVGMTTLKILWRWERETHGQEILRLLGDRSIGLYLFVLVGSVALQGVPIGAIVLTFAQAQAHPCACFNDERGRTWLNLMAGAGVGSFLEIVALVVGGVSAYRLIGGRRTPGP